MAKASLIYNTRLAPSVTSIVGSPVKTSGHTITIGGTNFGPSYLDATVKFGPSSVVCTLDPTGFEQTQIVCNVPAGTGQNYALSVEIGPEAGNTQFATFEGASTISYASPVVTGITQDISTEGGIATITGRNFGSDDDEVTVHLNGVLVSGISVGDTVITFPVPAGTGAYYPVSVSVGPAPNAADATFETSQTGTSYAHPSISHIYPPEEGTEGGVMTIIGDNFGTSVSTINIYIVGAGVCVVTQNPTDQVVTCEVPPGTGAPYDLLLSVGPVGNAQNSTNPDAFKYEDPVVESIHGVPVPTTGGVITLAGSNFGSLTSTAWVTFGDTYEFSCGVQAARQTTLECLVPPGTGTDYKIKVTVGPAADSPLIQFATPASIKISYEKPVIDSVETHLPTTGGFVTVMGSGFGTDSSVVTATYSAAGPVRSTGSISCGIAPGDVQDGQIICSVGAGTGKVYYLSVVVGPADHTQSAENTGQFGYLQPIVDGVSGTPLDTTGGSLSIYGSNFGATKTEIIATYNSGGSSCEVTDAGHDYFLCDISAGSGKSYDLTITVGPLLNTWGVSGEAKFGFTGLCIICCCCCCKLFE